MKTAAVLPALGIGDALLMMIASHQLLKAGYRVTTYHHALPQLSAWFPGHNIQSQATPEALAHCDLILAENDNSAKIKTLIQEHRSRLAIFYPTYREQKHGPLSPLDRAFDPTLPMVQNIALAIQSLLGAAALSCENGIEPPSHLIRCEDTTQVLIHPTSREKMKNWSRRGFIAVAKELKRRGDAPLICVSPQEKEEWKEVEEEGLALAAPADLAAFAALVYASKAVIGNDSLAGHLASNLGIDAFVIANDPVRMQLWRPGWHPAHLILPPWQLPNPRWLPLRERHWQRFISPKKVYGCVCSTVGINAKTQSRNDAKKSGK